VGFQTALAKAKRLTPQKISSDVNKFIKSLEPELVAINRATVFEDSEDVEGNPIGFYSPATEVITDGAKKADDPFNLLGDTEVFLDSIFAKQQPDSIFFGSTDPKLQSVLSNLLTTNIFGLQEDDLNTILRKRVQPALINYFNKELF